ncbi:unnamed protein product [Thelazia callipaeda]|uniref:BTB domain-containing protein n=1 Tax=Thelazia callipaeda TaxID=103827 RepID=A0A0N5CZB7_THECL|nr:unnamed protein product [Thelazia callipaeda]
MEKEVAREVRQPGLQLICRFVRFKGTKRIGRQLAGSSGVNVLLDCFLKGTYESYIVELCDASFELREKFESPGCITKIVNTQPRPEYMLRMLLCFAQDAWGRAALRGHGAIDVLVEGLETTDTAQQSLIIYIRYFIHDGSGLSYLAFSTKFLDIAVDHINLFLMNNKRACGVSYSFIKFFQMLSRSETTIDLFNRIADLKSGTSSSLLSAKNVFSECLSSWSPSHSPPTGMCSPQHSPKSPPSLIDEYIECMEHPLSTNDPTKDNCALSSQHSSKNTELVIGEIYILAWLSHSESNMNRLITSQIVSTLLKYIAEAPSMISKAPRTIRRIFRHRLAVENLSHLELHTLVIHILIMRKCQTGRRVSLCSDCAIRKDFGTALLEEFSSHIDAPFGLEVLKNMFRSNKEIEHIKACIAALHLVRRVDNWKRMLMYHKPVERLLLKLRELLNDNNYKKSWQVTTYNNGPTLIRQILVALSYLVPTHVLASSLHVIWGDMSEYINKRLSLNRCALKYPNMVQGKLLRASSESSEFITIKCGELRRVVPKKNLCEGSEYFRGMFESGFSEKFRNTFDFNEEQEQCSFLVFTTLLHFICGCGRSCVKVNNNDIPALLKLSDRYLCISIGSMLLDSESPIRNLVNGETLPTYLEVLLCTGSDKCNVLRDACISCLTRYCTEEQMLNALKIVARNPVAVNSLMEIIQSFLTDYCGRRKMTYEEILEV